MLLRFSGSLSVTGNGLFAVSHEIPSPPKSGWTSLAHLEFRRYANFHEAKTSAVELRQKLQIKKDAKK